MGNFDGAIKEHKEQKHESVQEKPASLNWVDATAGEGARAAVKSNYDDAAHRFVQSQLDGHNAFGIVDSAAREPGRIASLMNEAGSYAKGVADGIHEIAEHPGQTASEFWKGAKEEITQHPLRFFGTMGATAVDKGVTAVGAGLLAYEGSKPVKDVGKDLKVLNNPDADYLAKKNTARGFWEQRVSAAASSALTFGAMLGPSKTETRIVK
jgi:hypothetical protein